VKDAIYSLTKALPNAAANNDTNVIDLGIDAAPNAGGQTKSNKWRLLYVEIDVPALSDHTDSTKSNTFTLFTSASNAVGAQTNPLIQASVAGVASTGSPATTLRVPLPPGVLRYISFRQAVPSGGGTGSNATVTYDLVT
jgi:hypothetical protein